MTVYVSMNDTAMSGWGEAEGKTNRVVFICDDLDEAKIVEQNAEARSDMKYININLEKPRYSKQKYLVQWKTKDDYPAWYRPGAFKNNK